MQAGTLIWNEREGEGTVGRSLNKWLEQQDHITGLDALQDWIWELTLAYNTQLEIMREDFAMRRTEIAQLRVEKEGTE